MSTMVVSKASLETFCECTFRGTMGLALDEQLGYHQLQSTDWCIDSLFFLCIRITSSELARSLKALQGIRRFGQIIFRVP